MRNCEPFCSASAGAADNATDLTGDQASGDHRLPQLFGNAARREQGNYTVQLAVCFILALEQK